MTKFHKAIRKLMKKYNLRQVITISNDDNPVHRQDIVVMPLGLYVTEYHNDATINKYYMEVK